MVTGQECDLDYKSDKFWADNINLPFPDVSENIDKELNRWRIEYEALGHKKESTKVNIPYKWRINCV